MAEDSSLAELTRALTALTQVLTVTIEDQRQFRDEQRQLVRLLRRFVVLVGVLIGLLVLLLVWLSWMVRAQHVETAALQRALVEQAEALAAQTKVLVDHLPPH